LGVFRWEGFILSKGFTEGTEVLTNVGWVDIKNIVAGVDVLTLNTKDGIIEKDKIIDVESGLGDLHKLHHKTFEVTCGKEQSWYGWKRCWAKKGLTRPKEYLHFSVPKSTQEFNIICSGIYEGGDNEVINKNDGNFLGWLLSDGYYKWSKDTRNTSSSFGKLRGINGLIAQAQHKFYKEVESSIEGVNIPYVVDVDNTGIKTSPVNKYRFKCKPFRDYLDNKLNDRRDKHEVDWVKNILSWKRDVIDSYLYSFWLADGDTKGHTYCGSKMVITQNIGNISDSVQLAMFFKGRKVSCSYKDSSHKCETLRMLKNGHVTLQETSYDKVLSNTKLYSVNTNNNTYIIRQGKVITVTSCL